MLLMNTNGIQNLPQSECRARPLPSSTFSARFAVLRREILPLPIVIKIYYIL
jgi:hypothetical protein